MKSKVKLFIKIALLLFAIWILANTNVNAETEDVNGLEWTYTVEDGKAVDVYISNGIIPAEITVPNSLGGYEVTRIIGAKINNQNRNFVGAIISDTSYGSANKKVTKITLPDGLKEIGDYSFAGLRALSQICSKSDSLNLPTGLNKIGDRAFNNCIAITSLTLPNTIESIGIYAFQGCSNLVSINIPTSITELKDGFIYGCTKIDSLTIPNNVVKIGKTVFYNCTKLTTISLPNELTEIGEQAFYNCTLLNNIIIPNSVEVFGINIFYNCKNLDTITLPTDFNQIPAGMFNGCIKIDAQDILSRNITKIGNNAFSNCTQLTTLTIPDTVVEIGNYAFSGCTYLTTVSLPNDLTNFGTYVFQNCKNLSTINLSTSLTEIPKAMFYGCTSLNILGVLTSNITKIGDYAFSYCTQLNDFTIPSNITEIGEYAFSSCSYLTSIAVPESVTKIGNNAFASNTNLNTVSFTGTDVEFGKRIFNSDRNLRNLTLPSNFSVITEGMFSGCTSIDIQELLNNNITKIEKDAFSSISKTYYSNNPITIPDSTVEIGDTAFGTSLKIARLNIGTGIEKIGNGALYYVNDTYINKEEGTVELLDRNDNGTIHYLGQNPQLKLSLLPGVKVINPDTNEEITEGAVELGSDFKYKIVVDENYDYNNLYYTFSRKPDFKYYNSNTLNEDVLNIYQYNASGDNENSYNPVLRDFTIAVQQISPNADYAVRQFISKVNGRDLEIDRTPVFTIENGNKIYKHTKHPVYVESGDIIKYTIRVYNEGKTVGYADEIKVFIPEDMELVKESGINLKYGWSESSDGRGVITNYLSKSKDSTNNKIAVYTGSNSVIDYKDVEIELRVLANRTEENKYVATIAELVTGNPVDVDSEGNEVTSDMLQDYKKEESIASNSNSYIVGESDNYDYENIIIPTTDDISTDYRIKIEKIDSLTGEMLNGARFNLTDEDGNVLQTGVTVQDGTLDFGMMNSVGKGTDTYYIEEIQRPEGYNNPLTYKIKVTVEKNIYDYVNGLYTLDIYCDLVDIDINLARYEQIPIYTKEQFKKIGSHEEVTIEGETYLFDNTKVYKLMNDIDLANENWTPIDTESCMIDGNNFSIKNLTINTDLTNIQRVGLFGTFSGYVVNLNLTDVNINVEKSNELEQPGDSSMAVGALAGYMSEGIIKNCKVSGNISANINNVGGFVGHSKEAGIIVFNNCENSCDITANAQYNYGGFIGTALGAVNIKDSVNKGNITSQSTSNIGGFVGVADPKNYEASAVKASYDKNSKEITLTVKNESIMGKYKVKLENRDVQTLQLIEGSVFDILDENKQVISDYSGVVLTKGKLDVATVDINCVGTDIYYIKQISSPEGYDVITDEFIKVTITKTWNIEKDMYEVSVDTETINAEQYSIEAPAEDVSTSRTGIIHQIMEYKNVVWNNNKVGIYNCKNEGEIIGATNIGGAIGYANSIIEVYDSENRAEINGLNSTQHTGGFIGGVLKPSEFAYVRLINNTNYSDIKSIPSGSTNYAAGIIGMCLSDIYVDNCINNAEINGSNISGIVGLATGDVEIYNSHNNARLKAVPDSSSAVGGMLAKKLGKPTISDSIADKKVYNNLNTGNDKFSKDIIIDNCSNNGNAENVATFGGIVGHIYGNSITITNCDYIAEEDTKYNVDSAYCTGGILGRADCNIVTIDNCKVKNVDVEQIKNQSYSSGCIIGFISKIGDIGPNPNLDISITNITVDNCKMKSVSEASGILGKVYTNYPGRINIDNCNISNVDFKTYVAGYSGVSGVIGCIKSENQPSNVFSVNISNINLYKAELSYDGASQSNINIGGIIGTMDKEGKYIIDNCKLKDIYLACNCPGNGCTNIAGITTSLNGKKQDVKISNIEIDNLETYLEYGGNVCGVFMDDEAGKVEIDNCIVKNSRILSAASDDSCTTTSGILSNLNNCDEYKVNNCHIINTTIQGRGTTTGGIVALGKSMNKAEITNCSVEQNSFVNGYIDSVSINQSTGGIVASCSNVSEGITINNCEFKDSIINSSAETVGGIIGHIQAKYNISDCKVTNSEILLCDKDKIDSNNSVGGIIGCGYIDGNYNAEKVGEISKCLVKGTKIKNVAGQTGGIMGNMGIYNSNKVVLDSNTIEDIEITYTNDYTAKNNYGSNPINKNVSGIVANVSTSSQNTSSAEITNTNIDGLNILVKSNNDEDFSHVGSFVGCSAVTNLIIEKANVKGVSITNNSPLGSSGGIVGYGERVTLKEVEIANSAEDTGIIGKASAGGLIGMSDVASVEDTSVNNVKVNSELIVGGAIGLEVKTTTARNRSNWYGIVLTEPTKLEMKNITLNGITASGKEITGGLVGCIDDYATVEIDTIDASNLNITSTENMAGGLIGAGNGTTILGDVQLDNISVTGGNIVGGIAGIAHNFRMPEGANVNNVTVNAPNSTLAGGLFGNGKGLSASKINVNGMNVVGNQNVGGVVATTSENSTISDITIANAEISSENTTGLVGGVAGTVGIALTEPVKATISNSNITGAFHTGGFFGTVAVPTYVKNSIVEGTKVESTGEASELVGMPVAGGIVGVASDTEERACEISIENSEVRGMAIETNDGIITKASEVKSRNHAGGMIGFTTIARIKDSKVNNTKVTTTNGNMYVGAFAGVISLTKDEIIAQEQAAESGATYEGRTNSKLMLSGHSILDVELTGLHDVSNYYGCGVIE